MPRGLAPAYHGPEAAVVIDMHAHVGDYRWKPGDPRPAMTFEALIARMDDEGIDKAAVLPVYNASPEQFPWAYLAHDGMSVREQVLRCARYPGRLVPFGNMDPRWGDNSDRTDFGPMLDWFQAQGCRGIGEMTANIAFDDPRTVNLFRQIGERGMPVTMESCGMEWGLGLQDEPGSPRLERLLASCPGTVVIGHGPAFWAEIAPITAAADKKGYHRGRIAQDGSLARLFRSCPNLWADLSAASAFNALSRDVEYGIRFLNEFQDRLMFGTDVIARDLGAAPREHERIAALVDEMLAKGEASEASFRAINWHNGLMPQRHFLETLCERGKLPRSALDKILGRNAARLLGL